MRLTKEQAAAWGIPAGDVNRPTLPAAETRSVNAKLFDQLCESHGIEPPEHEYPFAEPIGRKWRFDFLFEGWLALECQGSIFTGGRHVRGAALLKEYEKLNHAVLLGYSVLFCTPEQIQDGSIFPFIKEVLAGGIENQT